MDDEREKQALFADVHCRLLIQLCQTFDIPPASAWLTASKQQKHGLREATTASSQRQLPQPDHASKVRGIRGLRKPSNRERTRKRPSYYGQRKHQRKVKGGTAAIICGLSGVGKSTIADIFTAHAQSIGRFRGGVHYLNARNELSLEMSMAKLTGEIGVGSCLGAFSDSVTWKHIGSTLSRLDDCCMVIDNADNEETLSIDGKYQGFWASLLRPHSHCVNSMILTNRSVVPDSLMQSISIKLRLEPLEWSASAWIHARLIGHLCHHQPAPVSALYLKKYLAYPKCVRCSGDVPDMKLACNEHIKSGESGDACTSIKCETVHDTPGPDCLLLTRKYSEASQHDAFRNTIQQLAESQSEYNLLSNSLASGLPISVFTAASAINAWRKQKQTMATHGHQAVEYESKAAGSEDVLDHIFYFQQMYASSCRLLSQPARQLLEMLSFLNIDSVSLILFTQFGSSSSKLPMELYLFLFGADEYHTVDPTEIERQAAAQHALHVLLGELQSLSLVSFTTVSEVVCYSSSSVPHGSAIKIHQVVAAAVRSHLKMCSDMFNMTLEAVLDLLAVNLAQCPQVYHGKLHVLPHINHLCRDLVAVLAPEKPVSFSHKSAAHEPENVTKLASVLLDCKPPDSALFIWLQLCHGAKKCIIDPRCYSACILYAETGMALRKCLPGYCEAADHTLSSIIQWHNRTVKKGRNLRRLSFQVVRLTLSLERSAARSLLSTLFTIASCYMRLQPHSEYWEQLSLNRTTNCLDSDFYVMAEVLGRSNIPEVDDEYGMDRCTAWVSGKSANNIVESNLKEISRCMEDVFVAFFCSAGDLQAAKYAVDERHCLQRLHENMQRCCCSISSAISEALLAESNGIQSKPDAHRPPTLESWSVDSNAWSLDYHLAEYLYSFQEASCRTLQMWLTGNIVHVMWAFIVLCRIHGKKRHAIVALERLLIFARSEEKFSSWMIYILIEMVCDSPLQIGCAIREIHLLD